MKIMELWMFTIEWGEAKGLLAPTRDGLQTMLKICENYANAHNLTFSTDVDPQKSKSKCIFFRKGNEETPSRVWLCGRPLEWVPKADHLGHTLHFSASQDLDCNMARGAYIHRYLKWNPQSVQFWFSRTEVNCCPNICMLLVWLQSVESLWGSSF